MFVFIALSLRTTLQMDSFDVDIKNRKLLVGRPPKGTEKPEDISLTLDRGSVCEDLL